MTAMLLSPVRNAVCALIVPNDIADSLIMKDAQRGLQNMLYFSPDCTQISGQISTTTILYREVWTAPCIIALHPSILQTIGSSSSRKKQHSTGHLTGGYCL
mmetsp:Transcript_9171/g.16288  ORF Transcript_9171/g.16288 Transcript_9171/m.16288 type:complete len:101 (-) Transcript_9171:178-480(-)